MKSAFKISCGSAIFALALGTIGVAQAIAADTQQQTLVNLQIAGDITMVCDDAANMAMPAGFGKDAAPVECRVTMNNPGSYIIDATSSARLIGAQDNTKGINQLAGTFNTPVALQDNTNSAWGLYEKGVDGVVSCKSLDVTAAEWFNAGRLVNETPFDPNLDDQHEYKFCVGAVVVQNDPDVVGNTLYSGNVVFTATTIDGGTP